MFLIPSNGGILIYIENIKKVVRDSTTLCFRQLGSSDIHAAIELHRISVDNFSAQLLCNLYCDIALSCGSSPTDDNYSVHFLTVGIPRDVEAGAVRAVCASPPRVR